MGVRKEALRELRIFHHPRTRAHQEVLHRRPCPRPHPNPQDPSQAKEGPLDGDPRSFRERHTKVSERLLVLVPGILPTSNGLLPVPVKTDTTTVPRPTTRSTVLERVMMRVTLL